MNDTELVRQAILEYLAAHDGAQPMEQICRHLWLIFTGNRIDADHIIYSHTAEALRDMIGAGQVIRNADLFGVVYTLPDRRETP